MHANARKKGKSVQTGSIELLVSDVGAATVSAWGPSYPYQQRAAALTIEQLLCELGVGKDTSQWKVLKRKK